MKAHNSRREVFQTFECDKDAFELALRVLSDWNQHRQPSASDLEHLKKAFPLFAHHPPDEMACLALETLRPRMFNRPPLTIAALHANGCPTKGARRERSSSR